MSKLTQFSRNNPGFASLLRMMLVALINGTSPAMKTAFQAAHDDLDTDGDGVADVNDAYPNDATRWDNPTRTSAATRYDPITGQPVVTALVHSYDPVTGAKLAVPVNAATGLPQEFNELSGLPMVNANSEEIPYTSYDPVTGVKRNLAGDVIGRAQTPVTDPTFEPRFPLTRP